MANKPAKTQTTIDQAPPAMDYKEHEKTYQLFMSGAKWLVIISAITVVLLYFLINP